MLQQVQNGWNKLPSQYSRRKLTSLAPMSNIMPCCVARSTMSCWLAAIGLTQQNKWYCA